MTADLTLGISAPGWVSSECTILAMTPDTELLNGLQRLGQEMNMDLYIGSPGSPDLIAVPYKVAVVDPDWVGPTYWKLFLDFLEETREIGDHFLLVML